jgi:hypothetical protein
MNRLPVLGMLLILASVAFIQNGTAAETSNDQTISELIDLMDMENNSSIEAVAKLGNIAIKPLTEQSKGRSTEKKIAALKALKLLGASSETVTAVTSFFSDKDGSVICQAVYVLRSFGGKASSTYQQLIDLLQSLKKRKATITTVHLTPPVNGDEGGREIDVRVFVIDALLAVSEDPKSPVDVFRTLTADNDKDVRTAASKALKSALEKVEQRERDGVQQR